MKCLIHFTTDFQKLNQILSTQSLKLHYCKEEFCIVDKKISRAAHPMISFSEYDVTQLSSKKITYGKYGIAFSQSWVEKHRIHPVLYIDKNSIVANSLADLLKARRKNAKTQLAPKVRLSIMTIKCFTKNAIGFNSYLDNPNFNFRDENEWRFVPTKQQIGGNLISQDRSKYLAKQDFYNKKLENYPLTFKNEDIEFIFLETNIQLQEILKRLSIAKEKIKISNWKTK
ncbi:MAG: hypothetical protein JJU02_04015 [Cryomorphaceae bacterium]|nr:hypothetical protein [Cryomorphaceae bacterium]